MHHVIRPPADRKAVQQPRWPTVPRPAGKDPHIADTTGARRWRLPNTRSLTPPALRGTRRRPGPPANPHTVVRQLKAGLLDFAITASSGRVLGSK